jgi:hypothetical protein
MTIRAINEWLYHHGPDYNDRRARVVFERSKFEQNRDKLEKRVVMVCEQISMANNEVNLFNKTRLTFPCTYLHPYQATRLIVAFNLLPQKG